jgi:hypothetical protein
VGGKDRCWIDHGFSPFFLFIYWRNNTF